MKISYILTTDGKNPERIVEIAKSIYDTCPYHETELVVVGGNFNWDIYNYIGEHYKQVAFDETEVPHHITKKKNLGVENAQYDVCVIMHDYIVLGKNFYNSMKSFGDDWDVAMCQVLNNNGTRFRDWVSWSDPTKPIHKWICTEKWCPKGIEFYNAWNNIDYNQPNPYFAIPGYFWIAKKEFMLENPLNENLSHRDGEDIEWSLRIRDKAKYQMNDKTSVKFLKRKEL